MISAADDYWPAVANNLSQARKVWSRTSRILSRDGAAPWVYGFCFKDVVQAVLLFGAETWVVNPRMGNDLGGFLNQVERRLTGQIPCRTPDGRWR